MKPDEKKEYTTVDKFDAVFGDLHGLADVTQTKPTTIVAKLPIIGNVQTFTVQTLRRREVGDTVFVQYIDNTGGYRFVLPPEVTEAIARQRDALTSKNRRLGAKQAVRTREARGIVPGFLKGKKGKGKK